LLGWLEGLLIRWATGLFNSFIGWVYKKIMYYFKGHEFVEETEKKVEDMKALQDKAKTEINESGVVSDDTREAIRQAGRDLIRGKRD
jgi:hypothetical protein